MQHVWIARLYRILTNTLPASSQPPLLLASIFEAGGTERGNSGRVDINLRGADEN